MPMEKERAALKAHRSRSLKSKATESTAEAVEAVYSRCAQNAATFPFQSCTFFVLMKPSATWPEPFSAWLAKPSPPAFKGI